RRAGRRTRAPGSCGAGKGGESRPPARAAGAPRRANGPRGATILGRTDALPCPPATLGDGARGSGLKVLVVSGILPPDVGGPAAPAPDVAGFLAAGGHEVEVVVTADAAPAVESYPVRWIARSLPPGIRHAEGVRVIAARARRADVVYTTGMF